jgi:Zn-dependent peptidase ImmA (M78 family)
MVRTPIPVSAATKGGVMANPNRINLAVVRRRLSMRDVAVAMGIDEKTVSRWIHGDSEPSPDNLEALSELLSFPIEFFNGPDLELVDDTRPSFRARRTSRRLLHAASQSASIAFEIERVLTEELRFKLPPRAIPDLPESYKRDPEAAAAWVRGQWGLRDRSIRSVVGLLESSGVRVFSLPADIVEGKVSAFCVENERGTPFVLLNTRDAYSGERTRFDAAHELGHIVMHRQSREIAADEETEADMFAAAFLMPRESVLRVAHRAEPNIETLQILKLHWGVSVAALARRLLDLGIFGEKPYKRLCIELARRGRKTEPNPIPGEVSKLLPKLLAELRSEGGLSMLSGLTCLYERELNEYLFGLAMTVVDPTPTPKMPSWS